MDRGDAPPSPTCSSNRDSAHFSQDFGRNAPRRSQYRLFPVVLPTPPASPVTLQRTSLTKASGSFRRRSSSVEAAAKVAASLSPSTTSPSALPLSSLRDARKASLPELAQLRTVRESDGAAPAPNHLSSHPPPSVRGRASDDTPLSCSSSAVGGSSILDGNTAYAHDSSFWSAFPAFAASSFNLPLSPVVENPRNPASSRARTKAKPNLRINIVKRDDSTSRSSSPASNTRRPSRENALRQTAQASTQASSQPTDSTGVSTASLANSEPTHVAQPPAIAPPSASKVNVCEPTVSPDERRGRSRRKPSEPMHDLVSGDFVNKRLPERPPPIQIPSTRFNAPTWRPQSSDGGRRLARDETSLHRPSTGTLARTRQEPTRKPPKPPMPQHPSNNDWKSLNPPTPRFDRFAYADAHFDDHEHPVPAVPDTIANGNITGNNLYAAGDSEGLAAPRTVLESQSFESYGPSAALAAARAQVAALRDSTSSSGSSNGRNRWPSGAVRALSGRPPNHALPRPSSPTTADPLAALKTLGEECDVLHARYATLKAERQKISSGIITRLKEATYGPELTGTLLDDQLSLAAVSSSMDICIAKLKSLECRREDAIAALVAKTSPAQGSSVDNIAAVIASLALSRKPSTTPSLGSTYYAPTGRSTPDIGEQRRMTRVSARTMSYGSEPESLDLRLSQQSRKQSFSNLRRPDSTDKTAPATIIEVTENHQQEPAPDSPTSHPFDRSEEDVIAEEDLGVARADDEDYHVLDESSSSRISSVASDILLEELFNDRTVRSRANGKAAKVLGLLHEPGGGGSQPNLKLGDRDGEAASLLSVQTKNTVASSVYSDKLTSSEMEQQLQSFPRPKSSGSLLDERRNTGASSLTNGSSAQSTYEPPCESDARVPQEAVQPDLAHAMKKRNPSAQTIKVFLHDDELLHYYNIMPR